MGTDQAFVWLSDEHGQFKSLRGTLKHRVFALANFTNSGRLNMLALQGDDHVVIVVNQGIKYHWQEVQPRMAKKADAKTGDNRINSFAIGGDVEVRSGTLDRQAADQYPRGPLWPGKPTRADVIRIVWPNGTFQSEFNEDPETAIVAFQRLTTSCPFLFTWDGQRMVFVTDFLWSTPLGMYINAQDKGGFLQTTDWVKNPRRPAQAPRRLL